MRKKSSRLLEFKATVALHARHRKETPAPLGKRVATASTGSGGLGETVSYRARHSVSGSVPHGSRAAKKCGAGDSSCRVDALRALVDWVALRFSNQRRSTPNLLRGPAVVQCPAYHHPQVPRAATPPPFGFKVPGLAQGTYYHLTILFSTIPPSPFPVPIRRRIG